MGLKQGVDQGTFSTIANLIDERWRHSLEIAEASEDIAVDSELWETAMLACTCMRENAGSLHNADLYRTLKPLAFVPALRVKYL